MFSNILNFKNAYNSIMNAIENGQPNDSKLFFLDGPGGSGKTYLFNVIKNVF